MDTLCKFKALTRSIIRIFSAHLSEEAVRRFFPGYREVQLHQAWTRPHQRHHPGHWVRLPWNGQPRRQSHSEIWPRLFCPGNGINGITDANGSAFYACFFIHFSFCTLEDGLPRLYAATGHWSEALGWRFFPFYQEDLSFRPNYHRSHCRPWNWGIFVFY